MSVRNAGWNLAARAWKRLHGPAQWRLLWLRQATFMVGVTGVVLDDQDRVLLLRHRFWKDCPWGTPSGYLERGETVEEGFAREVFEETRLQVGDVTVQTVNSGFRLRLEVTVTARLVGPADPHIDGVEVEQARFFPGDELPSGLRRSQQALIAGALRHR